MFSSRFGGEFQAFLVPLNLLVARVGGVVYHFRFRVKVWAPFSRFGGKKVVVGRGARWRVVRPGKAVEVRGRRSNEA